MIFINTTAAVVLEAAEFQSAHSCIGERNEASNCQGQLKQINYNILHSFILVMILQKTIKLGILLQSFIEMLVATEEQQSQLLQ